MSRFDRNGSDQTVLRGEKSKRMRNLNKVMLFFLVCSFGSVLLSAMHNPSPSKGLRTALDEWKLFKKDEPGKVPKDKLLGGLLPQGFDENSCQSRYHAVLYHKRKIKQPSSHLISRLRNYEAQHKRCGPYTESYNRTVEYLESRPFYNGTRTDCNYVVLISFLGLGNKMLTMASAFLYALLTNRVLLVNPAEYIPDLFCEPFPEVSWFLPSDFPMIDKFSAFDETSPGSFGNMLKRNLFANSTGDSFPSYVCLPLFPEYTYHDQLFFCDQEQALLQKVPWLILKSNNYFIPSLFLMESFEEELNNLFPEKTTVFHLLGRYLFHPTNVVWGLITRYYEAYLARANEIVGIQIRTFDYNDDPGPFQNVMDQIWACVRKENLLPEIIDKEPIIQSSKEPRRKAVLMTSLTYGYFEVLRDLYWEHQTETGDIIEAFQPSHEEYQQTTASKMHNMKALAEIYLLSLTDKLVTSSWSTFGYVAQSLGGLKPWILMKSEDLTVPNPPCHRAVSMEPCFHDPPLLQCRRKRKVDAGKIVPDPIQRCEDRSWGLKLIDIDSKL